MTSATLYRLAWLLVALLSIQLVVGTLHAGAVFDERYNLEVPTHLARTGAYATNGLLSGGGPTLFDPRISTGPTLLLPIAAIYTVTGPSLVAARLVATCFFVLLLVCISMLAHRSWGRWAGLVAVATVLAATSAFDVRSPVPGPGSVMGEYAAAALLAAGAVTVARRPGIAGLSVGLAVLTKTLAVTVAPGFLVALILLGPRGQKISRTLRFFALAALPVVCWLSVILLSLGWHGFVINQRDFLGFVVHGGSGLGAASSRGVTVSTAGWSDRVVFLIATTGFMTPVIGATVSGLWWLRRDEDRRPARGIDPDTSGLGVAALILGSALLTGWWLLLGSTGWSRHLLIAAVLGSPLALAWLVWRTQNALARMPARAAVAALMIVNVGLASYLTWKAPTGVLHDGPEGSASGRAPR